MIFKKVLFHTHFRELALNSLKTILELKKAGLESIVLTHIIPRDEVSFVPYGGYLKETETQMKAEARMRFEDWQKIIAEHGIKSHIRIQVGAPNAEILSIAEEEDVDLIVIGRKKRTLMEKVYVGSHIMDILRRSTVPVLMSKYMVQFEWENEQFTRTNDHIFERPMLATDWSKPSENAMQRISALKGLAKTILVVHVIDAKLTKGMDRDRLSHIENESKSRLQNYCQKIKQSGMQTEYHLSAGKTVPELVRLSRDHKASMIVMGKTGKDWFQEYWLGGVSHQIAELSELPVLLIP
jgi:nucleotide-binding universal stress UspA family protein